MSYTHIPESFIRKLARKNGMKLKRGTTIEQLISQMKSNGLEEKLGYIADQFQFTIDMTSFTICKPESDRPDATRSPDSFVQYLVDTGYIRRSQLNTNWEPELRPVLQLCGIHQSGSDICLRIVEQKSGYQNDNYSRVYKKYASISSAVIHFTEDNVFQLRGSFVGRETHAQFVMKLLGHGQPDTWFPLTRCSKGEVSRITQILGAVLSSKQVAIPSTVGSIRVNAKDKTVDLRSDAACDGILTAIEGIGLPTNDTMDEVCTFTFSDPVIGIEIPVSFETNLKSGSFKFKTDVSEAVIDQVMEAFIRVCYLEKQANEQAV